MKNKVPDRWEEYKAMGRQIPGTRFICFKVPLREPIVQNAVQRGAEWFCPRTLMDHCHNLGLIVDLTFTDRFYDPTVFTTQGIKYAKLRTQGKVVPKQKVVKQFFKIVNGFLEGNKENEKLIGVHCTHGLNRTGYLVCRYMIQHLGIPADQAISDFNSARGHEQERDEYLAHLRQMKWQNEQEVPSDSEKEGASGNRTPQDKTPVFENNRRRSKRNYDTFRDEDDYDESWPSGPVRKWPRTPHTERRSQRSEYGHASGSGTTPSPNYYGRSPKSARHEVSSTSPYEGRQYYDSHYRGRVAPQYDPHFYQQQGQGVGPHRQSPRWTRNVRWGNNSYGRPRQYEGPRQYQGPRNYQGSQQQWGTPQRERETLDQAYTPTTNQDTNGSRRNPFSSGLLESTSPITPRSNAFTPRSTYRTRR